MILKQDRSMIFREKGLLVHVFVALTSNPTFDFFNWSSLQFLVFVWLVFLELAFKENFKTPTCPQHVGTGSVRNTMGIWGLEIQYRVQSLDRLLCFFTVSEEKIRDFLDSWMLQILSSEWFGCWWLKFWLSLSPCLPSCEISFLHDFYSELLPLWWLSSRKLSECHKASVGALYGVYD